MEFLAGDAKAAKYPDLRSSQKVCNFYQSCEIALISCAGCWSQLMELLCHFLGVVQRRLRIRFERRRRSAR